MIFALKLAVAVCLLTGCGSAGFENGALSNERGSINDTNLVSTEFITPIAQLIVPTPAPTTPPTPIPVEALALSLWFPEALAPVDNADAAEMLSYQISGFQRESSGTSVDFRLKSAGVVGGIMQTLLSASAVAPGVLPDVTLLRRSELVAAVDAGLIAPISESEGLTSDFAAIVRALGRVDGVLYGLPYNLEVEHLAGMDLTGAMNDFDAVLQGDVPLIFAAGETNTVSDVLLAQYREAAGLLDERGLAIEVDPLRRVFSYYEQAVSAGLVDPSVLDYTDPSEYAGSLLTGESAGVLSSTLYLRLREQDGGSNLAYAPLPTLSGAGTTVVDGWMWVITTRNADEQAMALRFIRWMMDAERQTTYHRLIDRLPSQQSALGLWEDADYAAFVSGLLDHGTLPLDGVESAVPARAMGSAFTAVLAGRLGAAAAANEVANQLSQ